MFFFTTSSLNKQNSKPPVQAIAASKSICGMLKGGFSSKALSPWMRSKTPSKTSPADAGRTLGCKVSNIQRSLGKLGRLNLDSWEMLLYNVCFSFIFFWWLEYVRMWKFKKKTYDWESASCRGHQLIYTAILWNQQEQIMNQIWTWEPEIQKEHITFDNLFSIVRGGTCFGSFLQIPPDKSSKSPYKSLYTCSTSLL